MEAEGGQTGSEGCSAEAETGYDNWYCDYDDDDCGDDERCGEGYFSKASAWAKSLPPMSESVSKASDWMKRNPRYTAAISVAAPALVAVAPAVLITPILAPLGFTSGGVVAGSAAAGIQSGIGSVAAGSTFAFCQSAAAGGYAASAIAAGSAGVALANGKRFVEQEVRQRWTDGAETGWVESESESESESEGEYDEKNPRRRSIDGGETEKRRSRRSRRRAPSHPAGTADAPRPTRRGDDLMPGGEVSEDELFPTKRRTRRRRSI
ncbi:hypothetical protein EDC01DRAFT_776641 [Geopyxis carbonaria]|nr:hypothetical protein EDC01DRAFT_776641 [Geopyxis carbonaria]